MAIVLSASLDLLSIRPSSPSRPSLALELTAHGERKERHGASRTVLAIDVSGSMGGEPLDQCIRSVDRLLDALGDEDELGVVAFSGRASRVVDITKADASGKRVIRNRVARLRPEAATNIEDGLNVAAAMVEHGGVILLSDGAPTKGAHTADLLREVVKKHRPNVSFFSLGYGVDHAEDVLSAIGETGGGGYEFVQDPAVCARSFARALGAQGDVMASNIELVIGLEEGVELSRFVGREQTRFSREGVVVTLPDMIGGARRLVVAELSVKPPGDRFLASMATVIVRSREAGEVREAVTIEVADREPAIHPEAARRVLLARVDERREEARGLADRGQFGSAASRIRALMADIEKLPGFVMGDSSPLGEAYELLVDEAMAFERKPSAEEYSAFRKQAVGSKMAAYAPPSARDRGDASQKLIEHVAGECRPAWLVDGATGVRHPLREECVIGRTNGADIQVRSGSVSRRHAEVFANLGDYWVCDLGSTNTTTVNGAPLGQAPHKLAPGDVVRVGEVDLRYEE